MGGGITKEDLDDIDIVDAEELGSDGNAIIFSGKAIVSTDSGTKNVALSPGVDLKRSPERLQQNDKVVISGTIGGADGNYTVDQVIDNLTFRVNESIASSSGGVCTTKHPEGASKVGFNSTGLSQTTASNVQEAIEDLDAAIAGGGLTEAAHELLDTLAHEIVEGSYDEPIYSGNRVDAYVIWETAAKLKKIREELYTYTGNQVIQIVKKQYDASGAEITAKRLTEALSYTGNKLDNVTRTLGP